MLYIFAPLTKTKKKWEEKQFIKRKLYYIFKTGGVQKQWTQQ